MNAAKKLTTGVQLFKIEVMNEAIITIPSKITKGEELIAIPRSLYKKFSRWQREEKIVDEVIASGERAKTGQNNCC